MPNFEGLYAERVFNEDNDATSTILSDSSPANTGTGGEEEDENEISDWGGDSDDGSRDGSVQHPAEKASTMRKSARFAEPSSAQSPKVKHEPSGRFISSRSRRTYVAGG
jgi:hypothetical protein